MLRRFVFFLLLFLSFSACFSTSSSECKRCRAIVDLFQFKLGEKKTEECFADMAAYLCEILEIEDNDVCNFITSDFSDEVLYVLKKILVTPHQICGLLMHNDCGEFVNPLNEPWNITIPSGRPPFKPMTPVAPGRPTLKALHLTDLHVDMYYEPGLEVECDTPQCCRKQDFNVEVSLNNEPVRVPAGKWGSVGNCDTPYWLFTNMLEHITKTHKDIDYVMVSGDLMSHAVWAYTPETHSNMVRNLSQTIRSYFPSIPVLFAVGNHEGVPVDNFAPHFTPKKYHMDWLYESMSESWKNWVPDDQMETVKYNGCYMKKLHKGLRVISLNNAYGDRLNFWLYINQVDPDGTLNWLIKQLEDAEKAGDKVHIVAHIPGNDEEALEGYAINYYRIINRFANTVVGQFFGHTHSEQFYMMYMEENDYTSIPFGMVYSAPSVTPYAHYQPAYRIYSIDGEYEGSTYQVIDYEEWFFNLTRNNIDAFNPQWEILYESANKEYGLNSQLPTEWNKLIERMKTDHDLFEKYYYNYYRRNLFDGLPQCNDDKCRNSFLCSSRQFHHSEELCKDLGGREANVKREKSPTYSSKFRKNEFKKNEECRI